MLGASRGFVEALAGWWSENGGGRTVPIVVDGNKAALDTALLERALHEIQHLTRNSQVLLGNLTALRAELEHHARIPPEVEDLVANLRLAPPRLTFTSPATTNEIAPPHAQAENGAADAGDWLRQRLPIGARGFLGVDLHVARPGVGDGMLIAELVGLDAGDTLATWHVQYGELCAGWLPLRLDVASTRPWRSLELRLKAVGGEAVPHLSVGPVGLLNEYQLVVPTEHLAFAHTEGAMITLRLWGSLPGIKVPTATDREATSLSADPVAAIPDQVVASVRLTRELPASFQVFGYLDRGQVLHRPVRTTPAAACISLPTTSGLIGILCEAVIDDARCQTRLACRLVVTASGYGPDAAERGEGVLAASEWIWLDKPLKAYKLIARLPTPQNTQVDVHLFTRLPEGGTYQYGRVVWRRFEAEMKGHAIWGMRPMLPVGAVAAT
jgi:hypothetical protein